MSKREETKKRQEASLECAICQEGLKEEKEKKQKKGSRKPKPVALECGHQFHRSCCSKWISTQREGGIIPSCALCKTLISLKWIGTFLPELKAKEKVQGQGQDLLETEEEIRQQTKPCPGCGWRVVKVAGCDRVRCPRQSCDTQFCCKCLGIRGHWLACWSTEDKLFALILFLVAVFIVSVVSAVGITNYNERVARLSGFGLRDADYSFASRGSVSTPKSSMYADQVFRQLESPCNAADSLVPEHQYEKLEREVAISLHAELLAAVAEFHKTGKEAADFKALLETWRRVSTFNSENEAHFAKLCPVQSQAMLLFVEFWGQQVLSVS